MRRGAIVLCGGRSTRMGRDKASLPFGPESLLGRVVRRFGPAVSEVVVVARPGQDLPPLPKGTRTARDEVIDRGPLGGLAPGLAASSADAVFVTSCDAPFLSRALVDLLFDRLADHEAVVPEAGGFLQPLVAVYRTSLRPAVEALLARDRLRPAFLLETARTLRLDEATVRAVDPALDSFANCNTPEAYEAALARRPPVVTVELFEMARRLAGRAALRVDATTLGEALRETAHAVPALVPSVLVLEGASARPAPHWRASVGGARFTDDLSTPLDDGSSVLLVSGLAGG